MHMLSLACLLHPWLAHVEQVMCPARKLGVSYGINSCGTPKYPMASSSTVMSRRRRQSPATVSSVKRQG